MNEASKQSQVKSGPGEQAKNPPAHFALPASGHLGRWSFLSCKLEREGDTLKPSEVSAV